MSSYYSSSWIQIQMQRQFASSKRHAINAAVSICVSLIKLENNTAVWRTQNSKGKKKENDSLTHGAAVQDERICFF